MSLMRTSQPCPVDDRNAIASCGVRLASPWSRVHTGGSIDVSASEPVEVGAVVVRQDDPLERVPMSWDQYLKLPERPRAEWVSGVAVIMNAPPAFDHGTAAVRLGAALVNALPDLYVASEVRLWVADDILRLPDLMVTDSRPQSDWAVSVSEPPLVVAEVLSPSTRSE